MKEKIELQEEDGISFWKNLTLSIVFFTLTPILLATSLFSLYILSSTTSQVEATEPTILEVPRSGVSVYASLPVTQPGVSAAAERVDAREEIVRQYLKEYDSPLLPYASTIIEAADQYGLDFRLVTAIAQQESNLCKKVPEGTYNCWGWGIHSAGTLGFNSYEEGIWTVTSGIKERYVDQGYDTIDKIMLKYTPHSNGSWAEGVGIFMSEMK